ncbi:MAG: tripartite tricarboxylate transporter TctB family protein [Telluria sp.]|nr:tripartite tricarboxylate transporter TctB family protein [Telluria sp.]
MTFFQLHKKTVRGLIAPSLFLIATTVMLRFVAEDLEAASSMARGIAGPITWPNTMLYLVMFCAAAWLLTDLIKLSLDYREHQKFPARPRRAPAKGESAEGGDLRIWIGLAIIMGYGFLIPVLGFMFSTLLFIAVWMLLGGIRKPLMISLVSVLGTTVLLYVFVKLALMPLERGLGIVDQVTLAVYRFLHLI